MARIAPWPWWAREEGRRWAADAWAGRAREREVAREPWPVGCSRAALGAEAHSWGRAHVLGVGPPARVLRASRCDAARHPKRFGQAHSVAVRRLRLRKERSHPAGLPRRKVLQAVLAIKTSGGRRQWPGYSRPREHRPHLLSAARPSNMRELTGLRFAGSAHRLLGPRCKGYSGSMPWCRRVSETPRGGRIPSTLLAADTRTPRGWQQQPRLSLRPPRPPLRQLRRLQQTRSAKPVQQPTSPRVS